MVDMNGREPSLSRLERESEQTRADLTLTVDELRTRISPVALKKEVKDYARQTKEEFFDSVERRARENPLQAVAIAAGLAYPVWRLVRSIPAPILLIGAGLALARPGHRTQQGKAHEATAKSGLLEQVREKVFDATDAVKEKARQASDAVQQAAGHTVEQISGTAERLQSAVSSGVDSVRSGVGDAASGTSDALRNAGENTTAVLSSARVQAGEVTRRAQDSLTDAIERHPIVVGGIGLFIGGLIAAALPTSRAENRLLGDTSDGLKNRARDLVAEGYETAKAAAGNVYEAGREAAEEQGLSSGGVREVLHNLGEKAGSVYEQATNPAGGEKTSQPSSGGPPQQ